MTNFTLKNSVSFHSPHTTEAIIPELLRTVWEEHNPQTKDQLLWEIHQQGAVSGDSFIKVAWEPEYEDPSGMKHPGRIRILPLNSAFCFPEYHPHDYTRIIRFKMKYRFWGTALEGTRQVFCMDDQTELLTDRGWRKWDEIEDSDRFLTIDPDTKTIEWQSHSGVHVFDWVGDLVRWKGRGIDAFTTPNHRWLTAHRDRDGYSHWDAPARILTTEELRNGHRNKQIITGGGTPQCFAAFPTFSDEFVELVGWAVTEGHYQKPPAKTGVEIGQSETANPEKTERIRYLVKYFSDQGASAREMDTHRTGKYAGCRDFYFGRGIGEHLRRVAPDKRLTPEFFCALTFRQAELLYNTLLDGDGHRHTRPGRTVEQEFYIQKSADGMADFQMLAGMLGKRTSAELQWAGNAFEAAVYHTPYTTNRRLQVFDEHYEGVVWCPSVPNHTVLARRNGCVYWTCQTYTELWTEDAFQSFVNDELLQSEENPLGIVPIVHIANTKVPSSPWGLSDIQDIVDLNRQYNEVATLIADIIDYYASPVTVVIGAKSSQLERGPKKVWAILNDKAKVENLELNTTLEGPLALLDKIKTAMHEITGIPVNGLGAELSISNTSGVALSLTFLSAMNKWWQKNIQYAAGLQRLNWLIVRVASIFDPMMLYFDPTRDAELEEGQLEVLDPAQAITYMNTVEYASPLPLDTLIALNEIQMKMALGLESKEGALRILGEAYPNEKMQELIEELHQDALEQGALDLLNAQIQAFIMTATGMGIDPQTGQMGPPQQQGTSSTGTQQVKSAGGPGVTSATGVQTSAPAFISDEDVKNIYNQINTLAAGTKIPQARNPAKPKS